MRWPTVMVLAAGLILSSASPALAKSYAIPQVRIQAAVSSDGTMAVREVRTYRFSGSFSQAYQEFDLPARSRMSDIALADENGPYRADASGAPGTFSASPTSSGLRLDWHYAAADTDKTFTLTYQVA